MRPREEKPHKSLVDRFGEAPGERLRGRILWLTVGFCVLFSVLGLRLWHLHLNPSHQLTEEERLHIGKRHIEEPRGNIFDRNGLKLATDKRVPSIWVDPRYLSDPAHVARLLAPVTGEAEDTLYTKLASVCSESPRRKFVWVERWINDASEDTITAAVEQCGDGVYIQHESVRFYPQGDTAAHLLGFVNRVGEASEGVELLYDKHLKSIPGLVRAKKDVGNMMLDSLIVDYQEPEGGENLQLTIDTEIQHALEQALDKRMEECNSPRAMGVLMDPRSGEILALASRPAFDPNHYGDVDAELRKNRALIDVFEPGSVFKIVTAAAALEHGIVTPETVINCEGGSWNPYGHRISDYHPLKKEPFRTCFAQSSNIALIKVAAALGPERLEEWVRRFGFGSRTSRDFAIESAGLFAPRERWSRLTMGSLPMGQEIAVTLLQLARSYAVIANGGYLVEPYFVERAVGRDGEETYRHRPGQRTRILSGPTAETMKMLCHEVVVNGTGSRASIDEYRVGGKTGTAQMAKEGGGGYYRDRYTTVFAGFAPVNDPRVVCIIVVQEPMIRLHYGGYVCGPVFKEVTREALIRLHVERDPLDSELVDGETVKLAEADGDVQAERLEMAVAPANPEKSLEVSVEHLLEPLYGKELVQVEMDEATGKVVIPDFTGMTKREARERLMEMGIPWDMQGAGWVIRQVPEPGTPLDEVRLCALEFAAPSPPLEQDDTADQTS
jgi:cell division protein FtsI/penicillin-binding protein 2